MKTTISSEQNWTSTNNNWYLGDEVIYTIKITLRLISAPLQMYFFFSVSKSEACRYFVLKYKQSYHSYRRARVSFQLGLIVCLLHVFVGDYSSRFKNLFVTCLIWERKSIEMGKKAVKWGKRQWNGEKSSEMGSYE